MTERNEYHELIETMNAEAAAAEKTGPTPERERNEYDDLIERMGREPLPLVEPLTPGEPEHERNKYHELLERENLHRNSVMFNAVKQPPDTFAEATRLSRSTGLPADLVMRNLTEVRERQKLADLQAQTALSPALRKALSVPNVAGLLHDDTDNLSAIESTINGFKRGVARLRQTGSTLNAIGRTRDIEALNNVERLLADGVSPWAITQEVDQYGYRFMSDEQREQVRAHLVASVSDSASSIVARQREFDRTPIDRDVQAALQSKTMSEFWDHFLKAPGKFIYTVGAESLPSSAPGIVAAIPGGVVAGPGGVAAAMGANSAVVEYTASIMKLLRDKGININDEAAIREAIADEDFMQELNSVARRRAAAVATFDAISGAVAAKALSASPLRNVAGQMVLQGSLGSTGEVAGTLAEGKSLQDVRAGEVMAEFFGEMFTAPVEVAAATVATRNLRHAEKIEQAEQQREQIKEIIRVASNSKIKTRSPEVFAEYIDQAIQEAGQDIKTVYVDPDTLTDALAQAGIDPSTIPGVAEQLDDARTDGTTVQIGTGDFVAHLAGTPAEAALIDHIRTDPDALTQAQVRDQAREAAANFDTEIQEEVAQSDRQMATQADTETVFTQVQEQLASANRFSPDVNNSYATLVAEFYATMAERTETTATELYQRFPLRIVAESPVGDALAQNNRGLFQPSTNTIALLKDADLSSFIHEGGHAFFEMMGNIAAQEGAPDAIRADLQTLLEWTGVQDIDTWQGMTLEQRRDAHEQFARGFEAYLMEGRAPNPAMQSLFQRFRAWLVRIYRNARSLDVQLTPEVREVMDRLIATDEQIEAAKQINGPEPLFGDVNEADMTRDEWAEYQRLTEQSTQEAIEELQRRSVRDMQWLGNARSRLLKQLQRDHKALRKDIEAEVRAELEAAPLYVAQRFLRTGKGEFNGQPMEIEGDAHRLSIDAVKALYEGVEDAPDWQKLGYGANGMLGKAGVDPDAVADMMGFSSGDQMIRALVWAPPIDEAVQTEADQRMMERFGEIATPEAMERAANQALAGQARGRMIATELAAIDRASTPRDHKGRSARSVLIQLAKDHARALIGRKRIHRIQPSEHSRAAARSGREAMQALRRGETFTAIGAKRKQLLQHYTAREAHEARDEIQRSLRYLRKFNNEGIRKNLSSDYLDQIDTVLERYELRPLSQKAVDKRLSLNDWIQQQREQGFEPAIDENLIRTAEREHYSRLTLDDFRAVVDNVRNIEHLARLKQKLLTARDQRAFEEIVDELAVSITSNRGKIRPAKLETNRVRDKTRLGMVEYQVSHRKPSSLVLEMDGFEYGGPFWERFIRSMNDRGNEQATANAKASARLYEIFKPIKNSGGLTKKLYIPEINDSLTREGRLMIALSWGNETNRRRIMDGDGWSEDQVHAILRTLTDEDWTFVQNIWDFVGSFWPQIAAKEERVTGVVPERVEAAPFITNTGRQLTGGYFPIKYDPTRSTQSASQTTAETIRQELNGAFRRSTTRRGHTKARTDTVRRPMRKDFDVIFQHVDQVIHDLSWHEWLIDANRLLRADKIDKAIRDGYGAAKLNDLLSAVADIAEGTKPAQDALERFVNRTRAGVTMAFLGWSIQTSLMQPLGLTQSIVRVGPIWMARGMTHWAGSALRFESTAKWAREVSPLMANRAQTVLREVNEIQNQVRALTPARKFIDTTAFLFLTKLQTLVDVPTFKAAYEKEMAIGSGDHDRAVAMAEQAVLDSQSGGQTKDLARIQRGGPYKKTFTSFYSFFSALYNLTVERTKATDFTSPLQVADLMATYMLLYIVPATLSALIKAGLRGELGDDVDDDKIAEMLIRENLGYMMGTMVGLRELGGAVQGFYGYGGPAGLRVFGEASDVIKQVEQGEIDRALIKAGNNLGGILLHYPAGQAQRTVEGMIAIAEGKTTNPGALLVGPPRN